MRAFIAGVRYVYASLLSAVVVFCTGVLIFCASIYSDTFRGNPVNWYVFVSILVSFVAIVASVWGVTSLLIFRKKRAK